MTNKSLFTHVLVFGGGMGAGYALAKKLLTARYQEDVAEVKDFYAAKLEEMGVMPKDFDPKDLIDNIIEADEVAYRETAEYFEKANKYSSVATEAVTGIRGKGKPIINYNKPPLIATHFGDLEGDEPEPDDEDEDEEYEAELDARAAEYAKRKAESIASGSPFVIEHDEFEEVGEEYERQYLYYYANDRVLCEDDDSMVEDEETLVGFDYEDILDMQTTVWVRNDKLGIVYEICRIDESYHSAVANVVETPKERDFRIKGRRKQRLDR